MGNNTMITSDEVEEEFLVTTIDHVGHREIRKVTKSRKDMKRYIKTVDILRQPEVWKKVGVKDADKT